MSFVEALKGRRLFQIVASATAAGWVVLQVVDQLANRGVVPEVLYYLTLVWSGAGVLAAAIVGWHHGEKGRQRVPRSEVVTLSVLGIATLVASVVVTSRNSGEPDATVPSLNAGLSPSRVAVKYFSDDSRDSSLGYLADGLTESLIYELSTVEQLDVLSQNASLRYRSPGMTDDSLATALQVGTLVTGSLRPDGDGLEIVVGLVDGNSGRSIERRSFNTTSRDISEVREGTASQVAAFLRERVGTEIEFRGARQATAVAEAWEDVLRADASLKEFEQGVQDGDVQAILAARAAADSTLAQAALADPVWPAPPTKRAYLASRMAQLTEDDPLEASEWIDVGLGHVDEALRLNGDWAEALEVRGVLQYMRWRYGLERDPLAARQLLADAEADLSRAVELDPTRARAYNLLSIIASQEPDLVRAKLMARRAYEEDAYLRAAEGTLYRLYATSYDLEDFTDALFYCEEGQRRFPDHHNFAECELWLRAAGVLDPDIDRAWELAAQALEASPPGETEHSRSRYQVIVGGVIAEAGLPDSARAVLESARVDASIDPSRELLGHEAVFRLRMGDRDEALALLQQYLSVSPEHREGWQWTTHWWWRDLKDDPEFRALLGVG